MAKIDSRKVASKVLTDEQKLVATLAAQILPLYTHYVNGSISCAVDGAKEILRLVKGE